MKWFIENWYIAVALGVAVGVGVGLIYRFLGLPTEKQKAKVKEWLVWACIEAERALRSGIGQLKLRQVYDMFCAVPAFTWVARVVSFELFSDWVADALIIAKKMLINNQALAEYVYGEQAQIEVAKIKEQLGEV